ncbi:MAG: glycine-rich protein [Roseburia sp.]|nr:glycine-rich protein [Roseburia sp.]
MKKQRNRSAVLTTKGFLIILMSVVVAIAIGVTCVLVSFGTSSKRMSVDSEDGSVYQSTTYTPASGTNYNSGSILYNGDQLKYTNTSSVYSVTLPMGIYKIEVYGGAGGKNGNGETGGLGGYARTGLTLKSSMTLYMYVGGKGGDASGATGGAGGVTAGRTSGGKGGNGTSGNGGGGGGGRSHIALTSTCTSGDYSCSAHLLIEAGGGGGRGGKGNGSTPNAAAQNSGGTGGNGSGAANAGAGGTSTAGSGTSGGGGGGATTSAAGAGGAVQCPTAVSSNDGTYYPAGGGGGGAGYYSGGGGAGGSRYGNSTRAVGTNGSAGGSSGVGGAGGNGASSARGWYSGVGGGGGGGSGYIKSGALSQNSNAVLGAVTVNNKYVNQSVTVASGTNSSDAAGYILITALEVNRDPTETATVYSLGEKTRGTYTNISFSASDIARDLNVNGTASGQNLRFSNGTTTNLDTVNTAASTSSSSNSGVPIYLNSTKTVSAVDYISWKYNSSTLKIEITEIKRIPRKNYTTGCTDDNILNLYVHVRDDYGGTASGASAKRGYALIHFTLTIKETSEAYHYSVNGSDTANINKKTTNTTNKVRVGKSAGTSLTSVTGNSDATYIYNPNGSGKYTAFVTGDMKVYNSSVYTTASAVDGISVQLQASDLITNFKSTYDMALISLDSTTGITSSNSSRQYKIRELDNESGYTSYKVTNARKNDSSGTYIPNAFTQITIVGMKSGSNYIVLPVTLYVVEKTGARGTNYQSTYFTPVSMNIVFKVTNARPVMRNMNSVPVISTTALNTITVGFTSGTNAINLNTYFIDSDVTSMTSSTHKIMEVKLPTSEYVQVTKDGKVVSVSSPSSGMYYNAIKGAGYPTSAAFTAAATSGELGSGYETGFPTDIVTTGAVNSDKAFIQYSYTQSALSVYALRASRSMYASGRSGGKAITADGSSYANNTYAKNPGHFYLLIRINDLGDSDDTGIWLPIAVLINNSAPTPISTERGSAGASIMPTAEGNVNAEFVFSPMGITANGTTYPIGKYKKSDGTLTSDGLQALASDADNFYTTTMLADGHLNDLLKVTDGNSTLQGRVSNNSDGRFFTVTTEDIYIPVSYFDGRVTTSAANASATTVNIGGVDYKTIKGVRIKLNSWTFNRYMYQRVTVTDQNSAGTASNTPVYIAVKVNNTAPTAVAEASAAKIDYTYNGTDILMQYTAGEVPTIRYDIPVDSTVFITPYDILTDYDMTEAGIAYPEKGFTLNGFSGAYNSNTKAFTVGGVAGSGDLAVSALGDGRNSAYYDYSSGTYKTAMIDALSGATNKKGLNLSQSYSTCFAANNRFGSPGTKSLGVDRLYFKRTDDAQYLDGYTFDPYTNTSINKFTEPNVSNGTYLDLNFGSSIYIDGTRYYLDFLAITGKSRMQVGMKAEFELEIRDRTGSGAAGASYGIKKIKVEVRVVNSTPYLSDPDAIHTVSTTATSYNDNGTTVDVPTTLSIAVKKEQTVNNVRVFADDSFLKDNEDIDIMFMPEKGVRVFDDTDSETDGISYTEGGISVAAGRAYLGNYLGVNITSDTITLTALNSTQKVNTLWLEFYATDGRSDEEFSVLKIRVEVLNSKMTVNYGDDGFVKGEAGTSTNGMNLWVIDAVNATDAESDRYFAPNSSSAAKFAGDKNVSAAKIKALTTDADPLQGAVLSPAVGLLIPSAQSSALKDYVPDISSSVILNWLNGNSSNAVGSTHEYVDLGSCNIWFFDGTAWKTRADVVTELGETTLSNVGSAVASKYFDASGRWKVTDWVISVKPKKAFPSGQYLQLTVLMRDQAAYGGDTFKLDTSFKNGSAAVVDGYTTYSYQMTIKSPGIVTYNYYDQFGGYYTVADGVDGNINYVSTVKDTGNAPGTTSGEVYVNGNDYEYATGETAFKYSHTIKVNSSEDIKTYIPMSYMALRNGLVNEVGGNVVYETTEYVAYDIGGGSPYDRYDLNAISPAITISDGEHEWSGNEYGDDYALSENPYVQIFSYANGVGSGDEDYSNSKSSPYFNNNLAVANKKSVEGTASEIYTNASVGDKFADGNALYLAAQSTSLLEHQFGIYLTKKTTRASSVNLTLSVNVALCQNDNGRTKINYGSGTTEAERAEDKEKKTATVVFNLEIGNSEISLTPDASSSVANAVNGDAINGYYTYVELYNGGTPFSYTLAKTAGNSTYNKNVVFADNDTGDQAYFYFDSTKKLGSWSSGESAYKRANTYGSEKYTNTAPDNAVAQASMRKYFTDRISTPVTTYNGNATDSFTPNGGLYGTDDEGYSEYFGVAVTEGGTKLSITPYAKTVLSGVSEANYAARGLVVSESSDGTVTKAYYPLHILIYDSCGDGWNSASYVSLEIRVCVLNAAPMLKQSLTEATALRNESRITQLVKTQLNGATAGDKAVEITVGVGEGSAYALNVSELISDSDLLVTNRNSYWSIPAGTSAFKQETGDIFATPFYNGVLSDASAANTALRGGTMKFFDYKTNSQSSAQPDVMMTMNFDGSALTTASVPSDNYIRFKVNRRTTYKNGNNIVSQSQFLISLKFKDSSGAETKTLYIILNVENNIPTVRLADVTSNVTMRVGDHFTLLTTPYDYFSGTNADVDASASANNSYTYSSYVSNYNNFVSDKNEYLGTGAYPSYSQLTAANLAQPAYKLRSSRTDEPANANLGYAGIAKDDTPWALRITNVKASSDGLLCNVQDLVTNENQSGKGYLSLNVIADKVCTNVQIVVTLSDGEANGAIQFTMYVSVASSKPTPITSVENGHTATLNQGLALHFDAQDNRNDSYEYRTDSNGDVVVSGGLVEALGVYDLYMVALSDSTSKTRSVQISDNGNTKTVSAYETLQVNIRNVARDLDEDDNNNIGLFRTGKRFSLNGFPMEPERNNDSVYANDKYKIEILDSLETSFRITCLSFDAYTDWDELSFYVRDNGNDIMDNTVKIVIRICTLYSAVTNKHAIQNAQPNGSTFYTAYAETVNVKSYDDFSGFSVDIDTRDPEGPNGERTIVGVQSTYQFLSYNGKPASVDQTADGFISDPDVASSTANLNYDVKVYAFVDLNDGAAVCLKPADITKKYFDVGAARQNPTNYFKISDKYKSTEPGNADREEINGYLVGGKHADGTSYDSALNPDLLEYINNYFSFEMGADGVSLTFTPVTANLNTQILFYVEVEKYVNPAESRFVLPTASTAISGGSLFYVQVENSAPIANDDADTVSARSFTGKVNDYAFFSVFDSEDRLSPMFRDSDVEDTVTIKGHESGTTAADYNDAFSGVPATLDWRSGNGKARAIDIVANNGDSPKNYRKNSATTISIPAHSLLVYINRRIDVKDTQGVYQEAVSFDIKFTGEDSKKKTATSTLHITIVNSDFTVKNDALKSVLDKDGYGYTLSQGVDEYSYVLDTYVTKDNPALELKVYEWLSDPDNPNNNAITDEDSYRLVSNDDAHKADYVTDGEFEVSTIIGTTKTRLASITPAFKDNDKNHFLSITVSPESYLRGYTGTAYLQILDRSGSGLADNGSHGVFITVNVTILNSAPVALHPGEITEYAIVGSTTDALSDIAIDIADFVTDPNDTDKPSQAGISDTYLRIVGVDILPSESLTSTAVDSMQNSLVVVGYDPNDPYNVKLLIKPQTGFFGTQSVQITVADDDVGTKSVTFTVRFKVSYNFAEIGGLNDITVLRGMTTTLTPELLVSELDNTYVAGSKSAPHVVASSDMGISTSADGDDDTTELPKFNPGADYVVTKVTVPASYTDYVRVTETDGVWKFRAIRLTQQSDIELNAEFTLASDVGKENAVAYPAKFKVHIDENPKPELIEAFKNGYTFYQSGDGYLLNDDGVVNLTPDKMFTDNPGDILKFISAKSDIPALVDVRVTAEDNLEIQFFANGRAQITVEVSDTTDEAKSFTFTVINIDMPNPTFWQRIVISFESHTWIWIGVLGAVVLAIIILIIVIIALKHRKRKREELEAILMSEMELEEQMMRLAAPGATAYQSYGYLPPTMNAQQDPNLMLGTGAGFDPTTPPIELNPGVESAQPTQQPQSGPVNYGGNGNNNGFPPESGM